MVSRARLLPRRRSTISANAVRPLRVNGVSPPPDPADRQPHPPGSLTAAGLASSLDPAPLPPCPLSPPALLLLTLIAPPAPLTVLALLDEVAASGAATHVPPSHVPPAQTAPSAFAGLEQRPVTASQIPDSWQSSMGTHETGFAPAQTPI